MRRLDAAESRAPRPPRILPVPVRSPFTLLLPLALGVGACSEGAADPTALAPAGAAEAAQKACDWRVNNNVQKLTECVTLDGVMEHLQAFQSFADANGGDRESGFPGYYASADYVDQQLTEAGYTVERQPFQHLIWEVQTAVVEQVAPVPVAYTRPAEYTVMTYSPSGGATAPVSAVDFASFDSGCDPADYAGFPAGHIALVRRGACTFSTKGSLGEAAGAVAVIVANDGLTPDRMGPIAGTLGEGYDGVPVVSVGYDLGEAFAATPGLVMTVSVDVISDVVTVWNLLAELAGDPESVVMAGAFLDSQDGSPGINNNGSGVAVVLETALQMAHVRPTNTVRFAFWGASMRSLLGSSEYVVGLTPEEGERIAAYLNFDMLGSPNGVLGIEDGDASAFGAAYPDVVPGSGVVEAVFSELADAAGEPYVPVNIVLNSDQAYFWLSGVPYGGLHGGSFGLKIPDEASVFGGVAFEPYDPCFLLPCDTIDNLSLRLLDANADLAASAILSLAMNARELADTRPKGNFKVKTNPDGPMGAVTPAAVQ